MSGKAFKSKSSAQNQYDRALKEHTLYDLIFGYIQSDFNTNKLVSHQLTPVKEMELKELQKILQQKSVELNTQSKNNPLLLQSLYISLMALQDVTIRLQTHYTLQQKVENSEKYTDKLNTRYSHEPEYISYFKKPITGTTPLQFSINAFNYTEEDTEDTNVRVCSIASGLARLILAIDKFKEVEPKTYMSINTVLKTDDDPSNPRTLFDNAERHFTLILRTLNLKHSEIKVARSHIESKAKTLLYDVIKQLEDKCDMAINCPFNKQDGISFTSL